MIIVDLGGRIFQAAGELCGGEINILVQPPRRYGTAEGQRFLLFRVDANDDGEDGVQHFHALGVVTRQRSSELRHVVQFGGLIKIAVDRIANEPVHGIDQEGGWLHLVSGRITQVLRGNRNGGPMEVDFNSTVGIGYNKQLGAAMFATYDTTGKVVYAHTICLDETGKALSYEAAEQRLVAAYDAVHDTPLREEASTPLPSALDGAHRALTLRRLH
jgi:hypothetical protein